MSIYGGDFARAICERLGIDPVNVRHDGVSVTFKPGQHMADISIDAVLPADEVIAIAKAHAIHAHLLMERHASVTNP